MFPIRSFSILLVLLFAQAYCGAQDAPVRITITDQPVAAPQLELESDLQYVDSQYVDSQYECDCGVETCHGVCRDPGRPKKPKWEKPGDINRGDHPPLRYKIPDCKRAGNPHCVSKWAKCSTDDKYSAWYVGGGAAFFRGRSRKSNEGTFGVDYAGILGRANVWLNYTRDRHQGGEGAYATDGEPKVISQARRLLPLGH